MFYAKLELPIAMFLTSLAVPPDSKPLGSENPNAVSETKSIDLGESLKRLSKKDVILVAKELYSAGPLSFKEICKKTGLSSSVLNHILREMKSSGLVVQLERMYYLTQYAAILLGALNAMMEEKRGVANDKLFCPPSQEVVDENHPCLTGDPTIPPNVPWKPKR